MPVYPTIELIFFWFGLIAYAIAGATALGALLARRDEFPHFLRLFTILGIAAHFAFLAHGAARTHACPMFHMFEACLFAGLLAAAAALAVDIRFHMPAVTAGVSPLAVGLSLIPYLRLAPPPPSDAPESALTPFHIALVSLAYSAFLIAFATGVFYLLQQRELKRRSGGPLLSSLPSLEACHSVNVSSVMVGFVLLTVGMAFGFARAHFLDKPFLTDGRVLGSLLTWLFYGGHVAMRFTRGYHGRAAARMSIWSFVLAVFTLFGAALIHAGVHQQ